MCTCIETAGWIHSCQRHETKMYTSCVCVFFIYDNTYLFCAHVTYRWVYLNIYTVCHCRARTLVSFCAFPRSAHWASLPLNVFLCCCCCYCCYFWCCSCPFYTAVVLPLHGVVADVSSFSLIFLFVDASVRCFVVATFPFSL